MSREALEQLIDRWTNEPSFREEIRRDLEGTIERAGLDLDDDTWDRARGLALWKALIVRAGLVGTTTAEQQHTDRVLRELLG